MGVSRSGLGGGARRGSSHKYTFACGGSTPRRHIRLLRRTAGDDVAEKLYEVMFLLDSGRFAQDRPGTEDAIKEILGKCSAEILAAAPWQDGKLPYPIEGYKKGLHY